MSRPKAFLLYLNKKMKKILGFTLIEMLVVIGIIAIALPATFAIIFAIIRQQARVYALKQVKREGDFVLNKMEDNIRNNAVGIFTNQSLSSEVCDQSLVKTNYGPNNGSGFYFKDKSGNWFQYYLLNNTNIASQSAVPSQPVNLTTSAVKISTFSLSCNRTAAFSPPVVSISFDIAYSADQFQEQNAKIHYQTQVGMKNY